MSLKKRIADGMVEIVSASNLGTSEVWKKFGLLRENNETSYDRAYCIDCLQSFKIKDSSGKIYILKCIKYFI